MNRSVRNWLILVAIIAVAVVATLWATSTVWYPRNPFGPRPPEQRIPGADYQLFYSVQAIVSTINVTLAIFLLATYVSIYQKTKSEFTIGLALFSGIFLLNAIASNPFFILAFGYRPFGLGPFAMLSDLFTLVALAVLLYLSFKY
jgi:hypothetical protein